MFLPACVGRGADADAMKQPNPAAHFAIIAQAVDLNLVDDHGYGKS